LVTIFKQNQLPGNLFAGKDSDLPAYVQHVVKQQDSQKFLTFAQSETVLAWHDAPIDDNHLSFIASHLPNNSTIRFIDFSNAKLNDTAVDFIQQIMRKIPSLNLLDLSNNNITATGALKLWQSFKENKLLHLDIRQNPIDLNVFANKENTIIDDNKKQVVNKVFEYFNIKQSRLNGVVFKRQGFNSAPQITLIK
jgi:hypothetical protein